MKYLNRITDQYEFSYKIGHASKPLRFLLFDFRVFYFIIFFIVHISYMTLFPLFIAMGVNIIIERCGFTLKMFNRFLLRKFKAAFLPKPKKYYFAIRR